MEKRPILSLPYTRSEIAVQIAAAGAVLAAWALAGWYHGQLPDTIATHFNFKGEADGYGSKNTIFVMPGVATIIAIVLALLSQIPHQFNYLVTITEHNAGSQYRKGRMMLFVVSLLVALLAIWSVWSMAHSS